MKEYLFLSTLLLALLLLVSKLFTGQTTHDDPLLEKAERELNAALVDFPLN